MRDQINKGERSCLVWVLITCIIFVIVFFSLIVYYVSSSVNPKEEMVKNFELNESKFYFLRTYITAIDPDRKGYQIRLYPHEDTGVFAISMNNRFIEKAYSDNPTFRSSDTLLQKTPWNNERLLELDKRLKAVEGTSVISSPQFKVGQILNGESYYYSFFDFPLEEHYLEYKDTCRYYIYNERVVFEYAKTGDFDSECFSK